MKHSSISSIVPIEGIRKSSFSYFFVTNFSGRDNSWDATGGRDKEESGGRAKSNRSERQNRSGIKKSKERKSKKNKKWPKIVFIENIVKCNEMCKLFNWIF